MSNDSTDAIAQYILLDAVRHLPGGFIVYTADQEERIVFTNDETPRIFGCESQEAFLEFVHGSFKGMVHEDDLNNVELSIIEQLHGNIENFDNVRYRIRRKDGQIRWIEDYGHRVATKEYGDLFYVFLYDITDKIRIREEARLAAQALATEKELNKAKNTFIFNLSHDIRTPMNAILGYIELARRHKDDPRAVDAHLNKADIAGKHLLSLLDELLELAELDARTIQRKLEETVLADILHNAFIILEPAFKEKNISVVLDLEQAQTKVLVDASHLSRAITHILSNAAKFTPIQGRIEFKASRQKTSETGFARFTITISDNGIGMSEEFQKKAFNAFEREATSTETGHTGTGIGLTITRRNIEMMGGDVTVHSEKGKGSTFTISLPLKIVNTLPEQAEKKPSDVSSLSSPGVPAETPSVAGTPEEAAGKKVRVLIVEDIEINRMLAETVLTEAGFDVESVPDGCDAVDIVTSNPPGYYDAILMDIQMPLMNGYEATRAIRSSGRKDLETIPIIALSANARPEDRTASLESGMNAHIAKPFDVEGLVTTLHKYMQQKV